MKRSKLSYFLLIFVFCVMSFLVVGSRVRMLYAESFEPHRVSEVHRLRSENSETFLLSDGTYECVVYSHNKYYRDANGKYSRIENSIVKEDCLVDGHVVEYSNKANNLRVYFSGKNPLVVFSHKGENVSFSAVNSKETRPLVGEEAPKYEFGDNTIHGSNTIVYPEAFSKTDIIYSVEGDCLKEYVVLNDGTAPTEFVFEFNTEGYVAKKSDSGRVAFYSSTGSKKFELSPLCAIDAAGAYTEDLAYEIENKNNKTFVKVVLSDSYAKNSRRVYPIVIDPSIMITGSSKTYDSYVSSKFPNKNYYLSKYLRTGRDSSYHTRRTYMKFNLPSYINQSNYNNVNLSYIKVRRSGGKAPNIRAYRCTGNWSSSSITWNNRPSYTTANASSSPLHVSNNWYQLYTTDIVKKWLSKSCNNYGFVLKEITESGTNQWTNFYSSDAPSPNKPELHIFFNEGKYLSYGHASKYISIKPYSYNSLWQTSLDQSLNNWNDTSAKVFFYKSSNSNNIVKAQIFDYTAFGKMVPITVTGSNLQKFRIELNSGRIADAAQPGCFSNFVQSVMVHEIGHTIWLSDNPVTPSSSIMKYSRNRNQMTKPSSYDVANVASKY